MRRVMVQCFRSLGLLAEARSLLPLPDYELKRRYFSGVDATLAGDADAAAELMGGNGWDERWWGDVVLEDPIRVASLVRAGRATEAAQVLRAFESHNRAPTPDMAESEDSLQLLLAAFVDLAGGDLSQAERSLDAVLDRDWEHYGATFFLALTTLADIHHRTDRSEEAIALLERAVGERSRSYPFGMELWMSAQIDLAQLHRATGNEATAEALEGELRALTSQADPDFWLLRRLTP